MMTVESFLQDIENYLARTGMSASAFGRAAVGDPSFVLDLRNGRAPNLRLAARINDFMQAHPQHASEDSAA
jgi:hypothetical protein